MRMATLIKEKYLFGWAYVFRGLVRYCRGMTCDVQANMVLEQATGSHLSLGVAS